MGFVNGPGHLDRAADVARFGGVVAENRLWAICAALASKAEMVE